MDLPLRRRRLVDLALEGLNCREIGQRLGMSRRAVVMAFFRLRKETGCRTQIQLLLKFSKEKAK